MIGKEDNKYLLHVVSVPFHFCCPLALLLLRCPWVLTAVTGLGASIDLSQLGGRSIGVVELTALRKQGNHLSIERTHLSEKKKIRAGF